MKLRKAYDELESRLTDPINDTIIEIGLQDDRLTEKITLSIQKDLLDCFERDFGEEFLTEAGLENLLEWRESNYDEDLSFLFEAFGVEDLQEIKFKNAIEEYMDQNASPELQKLYRKRKGEISN